MDIPKFLRLLKRHIFTLIVIPLITVIITYFLVRQLPSEYVSKARIATGLVDQSKQVLNIQDILQESKTNQEFSNLLQMMELKKVYDQVSYKLILHDLTSDKPFRQPSKLLKQLNKSAIAHAIDVYTEKYEKHEPLLLWDADQRGLYQVISSMGYDEGSLKKKRSVYRVNNSDYVDVEFTSEKPELSAFAANLLTSEFIKYYTSSLKVNQLKAIDFLDSLQRVRKANVDSQVAALRDYKIRNRVLNLPEQAKILYTEITDFETKYDLASKDIDAYSGALKNIDAKFNPSDRQYLQSANTRINQDILSTTTQLKKLNEDYIRSNYSPEIRSRIDSLKSALSEQINTSTDRYLTNPLATKENLVVQKINLQVQLDIAKNSVSTLRSQLDKLNQRFDSMVPRGASLDKFETDIDRATKEYLEAVAKYNESSLASDLAVELKQIEYAMPGPASPSKMMLLVILSGIISFAFCVVTLFILFYLDDHIKTATELANKTGYPVLGILPFINSPVLDLRKIWSAAGSDPDDEEYRNLIRSLRFEIDSVLKGKKRLAITSISEGEGKTFVTLNLAYAYARTNKKVLVIDGNFDHPGISETIRPAVFMEDLFAQKVTTASLSDEKNITVLANRGGSNSLFELIDETTLNRQLGELENTFDLILIETGELKQLAKAKEWISVSDNVVAVFEADQSIPFSHKQMIDYFATIPGKFLGWVLNRGKMPGHRRNKKNRR